MTPMTAPIGFEASTGPAPMWLHTIELDRDRRVTGAVLVVDERHLDSLAELIGKDRGWFETLAQVHADGRERYLKLSRAIVLELHQAAAKRSDHLREAYYCTIPLTDIVDNED